jgi:methionyl-tRNA formyltransferase
MTRLMFMGTAEFAVPTLLEIVGAGHDVAAVYTAAPRPAGRGLELRPSPVERAARRFGFRVLAPASLKGPEAVSQFRDIGVEIVVVVAYGLLLPRAILEAAPLGCFNVHASLLPRWRGAAPIQRAIMAGDNETGVTVMRMDEGLDTGPIALAERVPIGPDTTAGELHDQLARLGADLMVRALGALERRAIDLHPQPEQGATLAPKISNEETRIEWQRPWKRVHDHCRGLSPAPGAWFAHNEAGGAQRIKVLRTTRGEGAGEPGTLLSERFDVACADGAVRILELQRAGRQPVSGDAFLRGSRIAPRTRFA